MLDKVSRKLSSQKSWFQALKPGEVSEVEGEMKSITKGENLFNKHVVNTWCAGELLCGGGESGNKQSPSCCVCGLTGNFKSCGPIKKK